MRGHVAFVNNGSYLGESLTLFLFGSLAEWSIAPVLKTGDLKGSRGSNPLASAQELTVDSLG